MSPTASSTDTPDPPLRKDAERNRQRILAAAAELFAERGLEVSLDDIAVRADVGVGTVYRRFENKQALVEALLEEKIAAMVATAERAAAVHDPRQALREFVWTAAEVHARDLGLHQVLIGAPFARERSAAARDRMRPLIAGLVERAKAGGALRADFDEADLLPVMLMTASIAQYSRDVRPDLWRRYLELILDGMSAGAARSPLPTSPLTDEQTERIVACHPFRQRSTQMKDLR